MGQKGIKLLGLLIMVGVLTLAPLGLPSAVGAAKEIYPAGDISFIIYSEAGGGWDQLARGISPCGGRQDAGRPNNSGHNRGLRRRSCETDFWGGGRSSRARRLLPIPIGVNQDCQVLSLSAADTIGLLTTNGDTILRKCFDTMSEVLEMRYRNAH